MNIDDNLVGAMLMIKNEEDTIALTINCFKDYIKHVLVFDTGSEDNTVQIVKDTCEKNNQILHLKVGKFINFPESRNEFFEFADTIDVEYLILIDAADEFKTTKTKKQFLKDISKIPKNKKYGLVRHDWIEKTQHREHNDLRFIRNKANCRYDPDVPVHVEFLNIANDEVVNVFNIFCLFQDRDKHGHSTKARLIKDVQEFLKAKKSKRNLYFLAQTYTNLDDFKNGFKYYALSLETDNDKIQTSIDERFTYVRALHCAINAKLSREIIVEYFKKSIKVFNHPIDSYILFFRYCIDTRCVDDTLSYIETVFNFKKPTDETPVIHDFFDYIRYNLISILCLLSGQNLKIGKEACAKAIKSRNSPDDINNMRIYHQMNI